MPSFVRSQADFPGLRFAFLVLLARGMPCSSLATPLGRPTPSLGCRVEAQTVFAKAGASTTFVDVFEPAFNKSIQRSYVLDRFRDTSGGARSFKPAPLLLLFHAQNEALALELLSTHIAGLDALEEEDNFIFVAPQGLADFNNGLSNILPNLGPNNGQPFMGTGWNVGSGGDENTCSTSDDGDKPATFYSCYKSCVELNQCGRCNWSTCHDDVAFVKSILIQVSTTHCIDLTRIYAHGVSNGGMLIHYLAETMPETFAALVPMFALPLRGYLHLHSDALRQTALLELHDRGDRVIPVKGGLAPEVGWEWYYEPLEKVVAAWASIHGCQAHATPLINSSIVVERGPDNFQCTEHASCSSGRRVISCLYGDPGEHGQMPHGHMLGRITQWFFKQFRRTSVAPWLPGDPAFAQPIFM